MPKKDARRKECTMLNTILAKSASFWPFRVLTEFSRKNKGRRRNSESFSASFAECAGDEGWVEACGGSTGDVGFEASEAVFESAADAAGA